jgi:hypothetical protein
MCATSAECKTILTAVLAVKSGVDGILVSSGMVQLLGFPVGAGISWLNHPVGARDSMGSCPVGAGCS